MGPRQELDDEDDTKMGSVVVIIKMETTMTMKMMEVITGVVHFVQKWGDFRG